MDTQTETSKIIFFKRCDSVCTRWCKQKHLAFQFGSRYGAPQKVVQEICDPNSQEKHPLGVEDALQTCTISNLAMAPQVYRCSSTWQWPPKCTDAPHL